MKVQREAEKMDRKVAFLCLVPKRSIKYEEVLYQLLSSRNDGTGTSAPHRSESPLDQITVGQTTCSDRKVPRNISYPLPVGGSIVDMTFGFEMREQTVNKFVNQNALAPKAYPSCSCQSSASHDVNYDKNSINQKLTEYFQKRFPAHLFSKFPFQKCSQNLSIPLYPFIPPCLPPLPV